MEKERLECDPDEIRAHFELLDRNVTGVPAAFVFNLDESGFQDWADRRERMVIVPSACQTDKVGIPIDRSTKRSSLLVCIAAGRTFLKPMLILPRKTIEKELLEQGINDGVGKLVYQENGFIPGELFREWCAEVFFPEIQNRREHYQYWGHAVLLMDGLTCHGSDLVEDLCFENECFLQFLPPHSSDQVQPCDLGIFGPMKTNIARIRPAPDLSRQTKQVVKIFGAMQTTLLPPTIIHAFAQTGIRSHFAQEHNCLICSVDPSSARCVRGSGAIPPEGADSSSRILPRRRLRIA